MVDKRKNLNAQLTQHHQNSLPHLARLKAVGSKYAGAFLNAPLNFHQGPKMSGTEFIEAILFRLGYSRFEQGSTCTSGHKEQKCHDALASHAVSCTTWGDAIRRHNEIADYVKSFMAQRFQARREVPNLLHHVGSGRRKPADICLYGYATSGRPLACDITITSSIQLSSPQLLAAARDRAGAMLKLREEPKIAKYARDLANAAEPHEFMPLGMETYGFVGLRLLHMLKAEARSLAREYDLNESQMISAVFSGLSVVLQRNNARAILRRRRRSLPPFSLYELIDPALRD